MGRAGSTSKQVTGLKQLVRLRVTLSSGGNLSAFIHLVWRESMIVWMEE